jgi:hypothetical protein
MQNGLSPPAIRIPAVIGVCAIAALVVMASFRKKLRKLK